MDRMKTRIEPAPIPVNDGLDREAVPQILNSRSPSVPVEALRASQAEALTDSGEVVASAAVAGTTPALEQEERPVVGAKK